MCLESKVLKRDSAGHREDILEMRRDSIRVARDMAYKRTAMLELARERPVLLSADEFDRFNRQIHRYAALVPRTRKSMRNTVSSYSKSCERRSRRKPTETFTYSRCSR